MLIDFDVSYHGKQFLTGSFSERHDFNLIPREARDEGPSVARLINLSCRRPRSGAKPYEFEPNIYLYAYIFP